MRLFTKKDEKPPEGGSSEMFLSAYDVIPITLPNGRKVEAKVLPLKEAAKWLALYEKMGFNIDDPIKFRIIRDFPAATNIERELNQLTVEEFFDVFSQFFSRRLSSKSDEPQQTEETNSGARPMEATEPSPDSDSMSA